MSFILEALKKVDRKRDDHAQDGVVMQGGRRWGDTRFPWAFAGVVLVAVAALTLATLALFRSSPGGESGDVEPVPERTAAAEGPSTLSSSPRVPEEKGPTDLSDQAPEPGGGTRSGSGTTSLASGADGAELLETADPAEAMPVEEQAGSTSETEDVAAAPPVRLVGRTSEEGGGAAELGDAADTQPPSELPRLVLQGTSTIDGKPVAVVNYQRLFEGDFIEGARVVKILDRAVELEFKGTRFTIRL